MGNIPVGRIISTHGTKGEVKFRYYNEAAEEFYRYASLIAIKDGQDIELRPWQVRFHKGIFLLAFENLEGLESVQFLLNQELFVRDIDLPLVDEDEYYEYQLIGLDVINEKNEPLGKAKEILHTGAHGVIVVEGTEEILIPMVSDYILSVDIPGSKIVVKAEPFLV
jgi:16S rRNA processing protein RimM